MAIFRIIPILFLSFILCNCNKTQTSDEPKTSDSQSGDAPLFTKKAGVLTVLMDNSLTSYFIYQGQPMGFEYEMLELFANENKLKLDVRIIDQVDNILDSLQKGYGDIVAANLSISQERLEVISFSESLFRTRQMLIQRLPDDRQKLNADEIENSLIRDRLDLNGKSVMVRKNSSYELILKNLISETGIYVDVQFAPGDYTTEQLIEMVSNKEIDYTICDENKAMIFNAYYDNIDINTPMSLSQPIAWAVNQGSTKLLDTLNAWISKRKGSLEFNMIANRYFELSKRNERILSREYDYIKGGKISDYDDLIKKYAEKINWDWRLLTAQIYKESKFNPNTRSWRGALGLMQVMPRTGKSYGVQSSELLDPEKNISTGTQHITLLENHWKSILNDSIEVIKFTLGSYNVGQGHVEDAIRLTEKYGLKSTEWDDNVALMLLNKSIPKYYKDPVVKYGYCRGREPVNYVETILKDFELYKEFTK